MSEKGREQLKRSSGTVKKSNSLIVKEEVAYSKHVEFCRPKATAELTPTGNIKPKRGGKK